jgi:uncharacterized Zn-finger protein
VPLAPQLLSGPVEDSMQSLTCTRIGACRHLLHSPPGHLICPPDCIHTWPCSCLPGMPTSTDRLVQITTAPERLSMQPLSKPPGALPSALWSSALRLCTPPFPSPETPARHLICEVVPPALCCEFSINLYLAVCQNRRAVRCCTSGSSLA